MALSTVVLVLLLLGLLDLGRLFYFAVRLQDAAREGARVGSAYNPQKGTWPYMDDTSVGNAVTSVLSQTGITNNTVLNNTCPATKDGNASYNPPYADSAYPSAASESYVYICWANTPGQTPPIAALSTLNVIVLYRFGLLSGFFQNTFGVAGIELYGQYEATVQ